MVEMAGIILQCTLWSASLCKATKTLQRGTGVTVSDLWPCPLPLGGADQLIPPSCSGRSTPRPAAGLCRCFSAHLKSTELRLSGPRDGGREHDISTELRGQCSLRGAAAVPSQLVCTILYSPSQSLCLTTPPLYSNGEPCWCMYLTSVQMHLFEKENEILTYLEQTGNLCFYWRHRQTFPSPCFTCFIWTTPRLCTTQHTIYLVLKYIFYSLLIWLESETRDNSSL